MAELLILRHAKSSWNDPGMADHDRPLNRRGRRDASMIGRLLEEESLLPDAVLCSSACRTVETWNLVSAASGCPAKPRFSRRAYLASGGDLLEEIRSFPPECRRGMILGHNPGLEVLVTMLTGTRVTLPTASVVLVEIQAAWSSGSSGRFVRQWNPKEL